MGNSRKRPPRDTAAGIPEEYRAELGLVPEAGEVVALPIPEDPLEVRYEEMRARLHHGSALLGLPRTEWLVHGWLPARSVGIVYGPPGSGKSFYALSLALELARGGRWVGENLEPTRVLYVAAERAEVLADRAEAWTLHYRQDIPRELSFLAAHPQLTSPVDLEHLCRIVAEVRPSLVVIDTLARCTVGVPENDGSEWSRVVEALSSVRDAAGEVGGSVLAVHHSGKDITKGARGHTVLLGAVDFSLQIAGDQAAIRSTVDKLSAAAKPLPEWYKLEPISLPALADGRGRDGAVLVPTTAKSAGASRALELLAIIGESFSATGITRAQAEKSLEVATATAGKVCTELVSRGYLTLVGKGPGSRYELTDAGRSAYLDLTGN